MSNRGWESLTSEQREALVMVIIVMAVIVRVVIVVMVVIKMTMKLAYW